jgi:hypothetical protein
VPNTVKVTDKAPAATDLTRHILGGRENPEDNLSRLAFAVNVVYPRMTPRDAVHQLVAAAT